MPRMPKFKAPTVSSVVSAAKDPANIATGGMSGQAKAASKGLKDVAGNNNPLSRGIDAGTNAVDNMVGSKYGSDAKKKAAQDAAAAAALKQQQLKDMPQLKARENLAGLGAAGQFQATTVANDANSPWKQMAMQQQGVNQGIAGDALAKNNAIAAAQGRAAAAGGRGAANSGMERVGQANMQSLAAGRQGLAATGGQQRQAIAQQAGAKGLATAQFNTGQTNQATMANVGAQRNDVNQQNAFNQLKYGEQMKFKGGQLTGDALASKGGKK